MIQKGSCFKVVDNSGAKKACCIHICNGYRKRYGKTGDLILVSVKSLRAQRRDMSKIKRGEVSRALVIRTKKYRFSYSHESSSFLENSIVLLNTQNKLVGTRLFGPINDSFRRTRHMRLSSLAAGLIY